MTNRRVSAPYTSPVEADTTPSGTLNAGLSPRLSLLYRQCTPGLAFWDFCCDHGHLGLAAWRSGRFGAVHFVDRKPRLIWALEERCASDRAANAALPAANFHIADAVKKPLQPKGNVVFAGVGGMSLIAMLECQCPYPAAGTRLILAPHRDEVRVKDFVVQRGWRIVFAEQFSDRKKTRLALVCEAP